MGFLRTWLFQGGLPRKQRSGDGYTANAIVTANAAAGAQAITMPAILGGIAMFTGAAGAVAYTLPATADIIAALPDMDIGDSYHFKLINTAAFAATITAGDGGTTVQGIATANANSRECVITKTSATTLTVTCG